MKSYVRLQILYSSLTCHLKSSRCTQTSLFEWVIVYHCFAFLFLLFVAQPVASGSLVAPVPSASLHSEFDWTSCTYLETRYFCEGLCSVQGLCGRVPCCSDSDVAIPEPFLNWAEDVWICRSLHLHPSILKTEFAGGFHCSWQHGLHCCVSLLTFVILPDSEDWLGHFFFFFLIGSPVSNQSLSQPDPSILMLMPSVCSLPSSCAYTTALFWPYITVQLIAHKKKKSKPRLRHGAVLGVKANM